MISIKESITLEFPSGKMEEFTRTELETLYKELGDYLGKNKETYTPHVDPLTTWPYQSPRQTNPLLPTLDFNNINRLRTSNKRTY